MTGPRIRLSGVLLALSAAAMTVPLDAQTPPTWRITRDLRIDASEHDLAPVGWLSVARDGSIIVSQPQDTELRFFDSPGRSLGTASSTPDSDCFAHGGPLVWRGEYPEETANLQRGSRLGRSRRLTVRPA
jgi:hypothetical protein